MESNVKLKNEISKMILLLEGQRNGIFITPSQQNAMIIELKEILNYLSGKNNG